MVQQICNCSAEIRVGAKICKVVRTLRWPLISDGVEEQALLRGVEDGSPTRAVAKSLRSSPLRLAPLLPEAVHHARHGIPKQPLTGEVVLPCVINSPPAYSRMIPGEADMDAALIMVAFLFVGSDLGDANGALRGSGAYEIQISQATGVRSVSTDPRSHHMKIRTKCKAFLVPVTDPGLKRELSNLQITTITDPITEILENN
ncbi:hypothetical protein B0H13DRAFT_1871576 [Mycena leptocephala]|nr:hypothetical protein B0H13DRAFT_1871576 [Mycena leptocephala]